MTTASQIRSSVRALAVATVSTLAGCAPAEPDPAAATGTVWFEECAAERGLVFEHASGHREDTHLFPEIMGGGVALADLDGDADLDCYLVQSGSLHGGDDPAPPNRLFLNDGAGRFADATAKSGAGDRGYGIGVAIGDVENDGDTDIYVANVGPNALLLNDGHARFADATAACRVGDPLWSVSTGFFDAENDGDLDLFVVNYLFWSQADEIACRGRSERTAVYCSPKSYGAPAPDTFYQNQGDGTFVDASAEAGFRTAFGNGLGLVCSDFDGDGWTDVFVANDGTVNQLWSNAGDGTFVDTALRAGVAVDEHGIAKAGMGVAAADMDDDGDEDLLIVNLSMESDSFYRNEGDYFTDRTAVAGLAVASRRYTRFGTGFVDLDNDGWLDLYQANGRVARGDHPGDPYAEPNLVLVGRPGLRFEVLDPPDGLASPLVYTSRGAAFGDVDADGGIDVVVVNRDAPVHLLRNVVPDRGRHVSLRVLERSGRHAFGASVTARLGERTLRRVVRSAYSYASACSPRLHLGLGEAERLAEVTVTWVDGTVERFGALSAGREHVLRRGEGLR